MINILLELYQTQEPACIYTDCNDTSKFHFGMVTAINKKEIAIHMISPEGDDDGIIMMNVENVLRVEKNSKYIEKMKKLCCDKTIPIYDLLIQKDNIQMATLLFAFNNKQILSIELLNSGYNDVVGYIESIDKDRCQIKQIDEYGDCDGISYIRIEDITKIAFLTQDEKRIMRLVNANQGTVSVKPD